MQAPVSVIIPCYRCTETIGRAVASIAQQTVPPEEVLLVEDCSNDQAATLDLLCQLQKKYEGEIGLKIVVLETNGGPAVARNAGWHASTQPYIAFLDADDEWHPAKLAIQYGYMRDHPQIAVTGHQYILLPSGKPIVEANFELSTTRIDPISLLFRNYFPTSSVMLKSKVPFRFPAGRRYGEDAYLWRKLALAGLSVVRIEAPLVHYYKALWGEEGLSAQLWKMARGELCNLLALHREGSINWLLFVAAAVFSLAKYVKRLVVTRINRAVRFMLGQDTR
jgi:glycosyltransferase involved in cell wall biosynthesis